MFRSIPQSRRALAPFVGMLAVAWVSALIDASMRSRLLYWTSAAAIAGITAVMVVPKRPQPQWLLTAAPFIYLVTDALLILSQSNTHSGLTIILLLPVLAQAVRGTPAGSFAVVTGMTATLLVTDLINRQPGVVMVRHGVLWGSFGGVLSTVIIGLRTRLAAAQQELERLACTDPLTGLVNRRGFADTVAERRGRRPFTIVYFDLDNLKVVNDSGGHDIGDALLIGVANACRREARQGDVVARFGGDEFVVFFADTDHISAAAATGRIRRAIAGVRVGDHHALASIGAAAGTPTSDLQDVLREADRRMYATKARKRRPAVAVPSPRRALHDTIVRPRSA